MSDQDKREKVVKGLEAIVNDDWMWKKANYYAGICKDALALLKAQEPKPSVVKENSYGWKFYYCPSCGKEFYQNNKFNFCEKCGQAVKWE